ncbi:MAG: hypothetical protein IPF64_12505 [Flavobacteriales bacterium]|nr:hypothetical protein [Flavobacteriales bacterium]
MFHTGTEVLKVIWDGTQQQDQRPDEQPEFPRPERFFGFALANPFGRREYAHANGTEEQDGMYLHPKAHTDAKSAKTPTKNRTHRRTTQHHHAQGDVEEQEEQQAGQHAIAGEAVYAGIARTPDRVKKVE